MKKFSSQQKLGEIVAEFPKSAELFKDYRIDFCCGGNRLLAEAVRELELDEAEVLSKLNDLYEKFSADMSKSGTDMREAPIEVLVDRIINKHHAYLWSELPQISKLTTLILRVHGQHHPELVKVHKLFHSLKTELELHLSKEEATQYPAIGKYLETNSGENLKAAVQIINELEEEHTGAGNILKELRQATDDYRIPDDVCETFELTYMKLQEMENDIFQHIHLENNILFPRLEKL